MTLRRGRARALLAGALLVVGAAGNAASTERAAVARVERPAAVTVLARPVVAGAIVGAEDLRDWTVGDQPPMRGALAAPNIVGRAAARRLPAGAVVREGDLRAPQVIRRGEPVTIVLRDGALTISTSGQALNAGGLGETVRVLSDSTRRTLSGRVEAPGRVLVSS